jgi:hypothetical protein
MSLHLTQDAAHTAEQARSNSLAPLNGASYQHENARVYGIIKQLVLEGPGCTFILCFDSVADGHGAWLALKAHYEGEGFRNYNAEDAYATLECLTYEGKKVGFTFETFIQQYIECYLELPRFDMPVLETKKVWDLLARIKAPELSAAKQQVKATANLSNNLKKWLISFCLVMCPLR